MVTSHGLVAISPREDGGLFVLCACGVIGGGVRGAVWTFERDGRGNVQTHPSIDMPGCFHTPNPSGFVPELASIEELADLSAERQASS
ncbi:hypothetical protein UFOVP1383_17 [uncultured Caudovirales phage]|uniref:Uncharacterized protein n=1 Tax=uncultured Caudovirales phage TaxID=2100421 RepID=A0A6J5S5Z4_9CAUD|nr:hypothetical protein UFOVP848_24 [uncultured Caudovirales phage]CAB4173361.1 hypothetical protein UFOVP945_41 [uncultured Caudovirales phage]CAB4179585.1 hypothetical protein UFOVP1023_1 [uncultured Caudovirales phage]CAB4203940.1 hypothetical protein UFOVP1383_17 [uncultured Caudovirales phage]CAB4215952.1 hypothetical protein UFOVP1477_31 [uncultured Caudovirales phage]